MHRVCFWRDMLSYADCYILLFSIAVAKRMSAHRSFCNDGLARARCLSARSRRRSVRRRSVQTSCTLGHAQPIRTSQDTAPPVPPLAHALAPPRTVLSRTLRLALPRLMSAPRTQARAEHVFPRVHAGPVPETGFSTYVTRVRKTPTIRHLPVHMSWDRED
jgi:hypothetical protein